ncbi:hypothetical protein [Phaeobacter sp.]|uniref:hypothetical protein n=1 Tax=Phaeobacter sp. TaxID=1902409 RepID=UPI0025F4340B|nr:hypothetical protein [Phaeobacter sp.]
MTSINRKDRTPANVAHHATQTDALPKGDISLLGLFGESTRMNAMVRLPSGRTRIVQLGSRVSGSEVIAIDHQGLILHRRGESSRLTMPGR